MCSFPPSDYEPREDDLWLLYCFHKTVLGTEPGIEIISNSPSAPPPLLPVSTESMALSWTGGWGWWAEDTTPTMRDQW